MKVAVIRDATLEEPIVVVCDDRLSAFRAIASYLEACSPVVVTTGERLAPRPTSTPVEDWVVEVVDDIEDIDYGILDVDTAGQHQAWCLAHREVLRRQHTPRVETIKVNPLHL